METKERKIGEMAPIKISPEDLLKIEKEKQINSATTHYSGENPLSGIRPSVLTEEDDQKLTKARDKFYLPVLRINQAQFWESKPISERKMLTDEVAYNTCIGNCCNIKDLKAGCCYMDTDDLEHVLGPVPEEWIRDFIKWAKQKGLNYTRQDLVIDFEEGRIVGEKFFNGHNVFSRKETYPILRFQVVGPRFACKFLNHLSGKCTIYEKRPDFCKAYYCEFIKSNFLIRPPNKPNTYMKIR